MLVARWQMKSTEKQATKQRTKCFVEFVEKQTERRAKRKTVWVRLPTRPYTDYFGGDNETFLLNSEYSRQVNREKA